MLLVGLFLTAAQVSVAQNSDLGFLVGLSRRSGEVRSGVVRGSTGGSLQINYAWQFYEGPRGRLYVELPFLFAARVAGVVGPVITGEAKAGLFLIPGIRYQYNLTPRTALYAAGGVGLEISQRSGAIVARGQVVSADDTGPGLAADVGGGLDFRLTRLLSLRGEVRDFVSVRKAGSVSRNNVAVQLGLAFHF